MAAWQIVRGWEGLGEEGKECKSVKMTCGLFPDDTKIVGISGEIDQGVRAVKIVMNK